MKRRNIPKVQLDWTRHITDYKLSNSDLIDLVDSLKLFSKSTRKKLVIGKYDRLPIKVIVERHDVVNLLSWLESQFLKKEDYKMCDSIIKLKKAYENPKRNAYN